jgi:hypothetical protein
VQRLVVRRLDEIMWLVFLVELGVAIVVLLLIGWTSRGHDRRVRGRLFN